MQIQEITSALLPEVRKFTDRIVRPDYITVRDAFFDWQYRQAAEVSASTSGTGALAMVDEGRVVAFSLASKVKVFKEGQTLSGAWHQEWYADPEVRGAGLFLLKEQLKKNSFFGVSGQSLSAANVFSALRRTCWVELTRLFASTDSKLTHEILLAKGEDTLGYLNSQKILASPQGLEVKTVELFGTDYETVWKKFRERFFLAVDRNAEYMNWRYVHHPLFKYEKVSIATSAGPVFYVWREEDPQVVSKKAARLCEVIGEPRAIRESFGAFFELLKSRSLLFVDFFCSSHEVIAALMGAGMRQAIILPDFDLPRLLSPVASDVRKTISFAYSFDKTQDSDRLFESSKTYFTKGDTNQDRPNR